MKTRNFFMAFAAIAALTMGGCTQEEELLVSDYNSFDDPNAVVFGTYLGQAPQSRAGVIDTEALKDEDKGFGVFAYYTGQKEFAIDGSNEVAPNFMCNQAVTWNATAKYPGTETAGMWYYTPVKYWPNNVDDKVSFFAYAPYKSAEDVKNATSGITKLPENTTTGDPTIGYTMPQAPGDQLDLLYSGEKLNLIKENIDQKVQFVFKHAMTRIGFERVIDVDWVDLDDNGNHDNQGDAELALSTDSKVEITSVSISSTEFYKYGELNLRTGEWDALKKENQTYTLSTNDFTDDGKNVTSTNSTTKTQLNNEDKYLMIFPTGETKIPVEITVEYNVITKDTNLPDEKSQITSKITTPFEFAFAQGKYYNFVLRIGLTSVKLDVDTDGWDQDWGHGTTTEVVVNAPYNNTVSLIYDANGGKFANGSDQYIVTSYVENWTKDDEDENAHDPKTEAKFIVETFQASDITHSSDQNLYFGGWTDTQITPSIKESEWLMSGNTRYKGGEAIYVEKTSTSASRTIYALWFESENTD